MFLSVGASRKSLTFSRAHSHPFYEIIIDVEGDGYYLIEDEVVDFKEGTVVIIPPGVSHTKVSDKGFRDVYVGTFELPFLIGEEKHKCRFFSDDLNKTLFEITEMMRLRYLEGTKGDTTLSLMYDLFIRLLAEKYADGKKKDAVVEELRYRIACEFNSPGFSINQIMENIGYDKDYVRRRFVANLGMTPLEYLTSLRIENAKKLLSMRTKMETSIAEIGSMCGYFDGNYFSRVFKKHVGITPEEYSKLTK